MVDSKDSEVEKEHSHRRDQARDLANLKTTGKGSGLDTLAEEQSDASKGKGKRKLRSDEVKHH